MTSPVSLRILCASDDRLFRKAVITTLSADGHDIVPAVDGHAAFDALLDGMDRIDAVVTDHQMMGFTGLELVEMLRQTTFRGRIYVCSAPLSEEDDKHYRMLRVDGLFRKDAPLEDLVHAIAGLRSATPPSAAGPVGALNRER